jgi:hypothetical protein
MRLVTEIVEDVTYITEKKTGDYYIEGIFLQSEIKNRNGRIYPNKVMAEEVARYNKTYVEQKRAFGELGHPDGPSINLDRVSHMITSLTESGDNWVGRAKVMDTPHGRIVKALMKEGAKLGVSSRGMGTIKTNKQGIAEVQGDFHLATAADIVADPSAPDAFVNGIMEGKEWVWNNGIILEKDIDKMRKVIEGTPAKHLGEAELRVFSHFISKL